MISKLWELRLERLEYRNYFVGLKFYLSVIRTVSYILIRNILSFSSFFVTIKPIVIVNLSISFNRFNKIEFLSDGNIVNYKRKQN